MRAAKVDLATGLVVNMVIVDADNIDAARAGFKYVDCTTRHCSVGDTWNAVDGLTCAIEEAEEELLFGDGEDL